MLTTDGNQMNMALVVQKVIARYEQTWAGHAGFAREVAALAYQLELIKAHQQQAEVKSVGVTLDKAHAADKAIEMGMALGASAYVYAKKTGNEMLKKQFSPTKKSLADVQGVVTLSRLNDLYANIKAIIGSLGDYVTKKELADFRTAIDDFGSRLADPRGVIVSRSKSNEVLAKGIRVLKSIFENMDRLISKFKGSEFEKEYEKARIVVDLGSRKKKDDTEAGNRGTAA